MVKSARKMCYSGEGMLRQAFLDRQAKQPDLARLERCLRLFLAGNPDYDPRQPEQTLLCNLPDIPGALVGLLPGLPELQDMHTATHVSMPAPEQILSDGKDRISLHSGMI